MPDVLAEEIIFQLEHLQALYYRLLLLIGPEGSGKTRTLQCLSNKLNTKLVNVNLAVSERMLDLTERQRILKTPMILEEIIEEAGSDTILLDTFEMLFDDTLKQNPLVLLQKSARNRNIVAAWNGCIEKNNLIYAEPSHSEYQKYPLKDFVFIEMKAST